MLICYMYIYTYIERDIAHFVDLANVHMCISIIAEPLSLYRYRYIHVRSTCALLHNFTSGS